MYFCIICNRQHANSKKCGEFNPTSVTSKEGKECIVIDNVSKIASIFEKFECRRNRETEWKYCKKMQELVVCCSSIEKFFQKETNSYRLLIEQCRRKGNFCNFCLVRHGKTKRFSARRKLYEIEEYLEYLEFCYLDFYLDNIVMEDMSPENICNEAYNRVKELAEIVRLKGKSSIPRPGFQTERHGSQDSSGPFFGVPFSEIDGNSGKNVASTPVSTSSTSSHTIFAKPVPVLSINTPASSSPAISSSKPVSASTSVDGHSNRTNTPRFPVLLRTPKKKDRRRSSSESFDRHFGVLASHQQIADLFDLARQWSCCNGPSLSFSPHSSVGGAATYWIKCETCEKREQWRSQEYVNGAPVNSKRFFKECINQTVSYSTYQSLSAALNTTSYSESHWNNENSIHWKKVTGKMDHFLLEKRKGMKGQSKKAQIDGGWKGRNHGAGHKLFVSEGNEMKLLHRELCIRCPMDPNKHDVKRCEEKNPHYFHGTSAKMEPVLTEKAFDVINQADIHIEDITKDKYASTETKYQETFGGKEKEGKTTRVTNCSNHRLVGGFNELHTIGKEDPVVYHSGISFRMKKHAKFGQHKDQTPGGYRTFLDRFIPHVCGDHSQCDRRNCEKSVVSRVLQYLDPKEHGVQIGIVSRLIESLKNDAERIYTGATSSVIEAMQGVSTRRRAPKYATISINFIGRVDGDMLQLEDRQYHRKMLVEEGLPESAATAGIYEEMETRLDRKKKENFRAQRNGTRRNWKGLKIVRSRWRNEEHYEAADYKKGCSCVKGCKNGKCGCVKDNLPCDKFCKCHNNPAIKCKNNLLDEGIKIRSDYLKRRMKMKRKLKAEPTQEKKKKKKKKTFSQYMESWVKKKDNVLGKCGHCGKQVTYQGSFQCFGCHHYCCKSEDDEESCWGNDYPVKDEPRGFVWIRKFCKKCDSNISDEEMEKTRVKEFEYSEVIPKKYIPYVEEEAGDDYNEEGMKTSPYLLRSKFTMEDIVEVLDQERPSRSETEEDDEDVEVVEVCAAAAAAAAAAAPIAAGGNSGEEEEEDDDVEVVVVEEEDDDEVEVVEVVEDDDEEEEEDDDEEEEDDDDEEEEQFGRDTLRFDRKDGGGYIWRGKWIKVTVIDGDVVGEDGIVYDVRNEEGDDDDDDDDSDDEDDKEDVPTDVPDTPEDFYPFDGNTGYVFRQGAWRYIIDVKGDIYIDTEGDEWNKNPDLLL